MPQRNSLKTVNTFVKGLITEANTLTYPEDSSVDELNCDLLRDGSRRRRLGLELEDGYEYSTVALQADETSTVRVWNNVGGDPELTFLVVQLGNTLTFYEASTSATSTNSKSFTVDLTDHLSSAGTNPANFPISVASTKGGLVVVNPDIDSILLTYESSSDTLTVTEIEFQERDFEWLGDTSDYLTESSSLTVSPEREYDTMNSGWVGEKGTEALEDYKSDKAAYPPITLPWFSGKDSSGDFDVDEWEEIFVGNTLGVNGHYIYPLFSKDLSTVSGISGLPTVTTDTRFSCVVPYSGRLFFSGLSGDKGSRIYFSQLIGAQGFDNIGKFYQNNDPTSEEISTLLDTDGGYVSIPEAYGISQLHVFGAALYVFAENGVWSVSGVDDVFRASEYSVSKITSFGLTYPESFVSAQGRPYWWSNYGIHTLAATDQFQIVEKNISLSTVQTYWEGLDHATVTSSYDAVNRKVLWATQDGDNILPDSVNRVLVFDEGLGSFYPWLISEETNRDFSLRNLNFFDGLGTTLTDLEVVDSSGEAVVDSSGNSVVVQRSVRGYGTTEVKALVRNTSTGLVTFATFTNKSFLDWGTTDYSSYVQSYYDFQGDISTRKNLPYLTVVMNTTEEGLTTDAGGYTPIRPSSLLVQSSWDTYDIASKPTQQAYRLKHTPVLSGITWSYPKVTTASRLKTRGRGQTLSLRFSSETEHDFHLLGWEQVGGKNAYV